MKAEKETAEAYR